MWRFEAFPLNYLNYYDVFQIILRFWVNKTKIVKVSLWALGDHDSISYCFQNLTKKKSIEYIYRGKILLLHVAGDIFLIILHIF